MIYLDVNGFPVEQSYDGGDSAVRAGITAVCNLDTNVDLERYCVGDGGLVRHPTQAPSNNPNNFTRDQMLCLVAGLYAQGKHDIIKKVLYGRLKSFCSAANTERDHVGSGKMKRPHAYYKDSNPNTLTRPMKFDWASFKFKIDTDEFDMTYELESKMFDSADPLLPNHMWFLIKAARTYWLYPFFLIGMPIHLVSLYIHSKTDHFEENQAICESYVCGTLSLFKTWNTEWKTINTKYWSDRNEIEYQHMLEAKLG